MDRTVTALPGSGELVHPGSHRTTHSLADALERMVRSLRANPNRQIAEGELFDAATPVGQWIDIQSARVAA